MEKKKTKEKNCKDLSVSGFSRNSYNSNGIIKLKKIER
jgi:hypothetical protein